MCVCVCVCLCVCFVFACRPSTILLMQGYLWVDQVPQGSFVWRSTTTTLSLYLVCTVWTQLLDQEYSHILFFVFYTRTHARTHARTHTHHIRSWISCTHRNECWAYLQLRDLLKKFQVYLLISSVRVAEDFAFLILTDMLHLKIPDRNTQVRIIATLSVLSDLDLFSGMEHFKPLLEDWE